MQQISSMVEENDDTVRIFVTTDNHLGFKERDSVRCNDSFATFEEALILAKYLRVDFILQAGDLFDVQKPSQSCMYKTIKLLTKYVLGPDPIRFEAKGIIPESFNFQSDVINVALPIFMIHGNHDPPLNSEGGDAVSPVDVLESSMLVNNIGRINDLDNVQIVPVIINKGNTKIALYGVGHVRDERMYRIFALNKVHFVLPEDGPEEYFCIFMIHQNRYKGTTGGLPAKSCIHEEMIPSFIDLVIWGHEHDCNVEPQESLKGNYHICQPGSSVVTALSKGDATFKRNCILEVNQRRFRIHSFPLLTTRPLIFTEVKAQKFCEVKDADSKLWPALEAAVQEALLQHSSFVTERTEDWKKSMAFTLGEIQLENADFSRWSHDRVCPRGEEALFMQVLQDKILKLNDISLPLIRVRVDLTGGYDVNFSLGRFGAAFANRLANADDILLLSRNVRKCGVDDTNTMDHNHEVPLIEIADSFPSGADIANAHELIFHHISKKTSLDILPESELNLAVKKYVDRAETGAVELTVSEFLNKAQRSLKKSRASNPSLLLKDGIQEFSQLAKNQLIAEERPQSQPPLDRLPINPPVVTTVQEMADEDVTTADLTFAVAKENGDKDKENNAAAAPPHGDKFLPDPDALFLSDLDEEKQSTTVNFGANKPVENTSVKYNEKDCHSDDKSENGDVADSAKKSAPHQSGRGSRSRVSAKSAPKSKAKAKASIASVLKPRRGGKASAKFKDPILDTLE